MAVIPTERAMAHQLPESFLRLRVDGARIQTRLDLHLRDLDLLLELDRDRDSTITWDELLTRRSEIQSLLQTSLVITGDGAPCPLGPTDILFIRHADGGYAVLQQSALCETRPERLTVRADPFEGSNSQFRTTLRLDYGQTSMSAVLKGGATWAGDLGSRTDLFPYIQLGFLHVALGADHLVFLMVLLASVLSIRLRTNAVGGDFSLILRAAFAVTLAFTTGHALSLTLSVFGLWLPPPRIVEAAIALTIIIAALDAHRPFLRIAPWQMALFCGVIHGSGYAASLAALQLPVGERVFAIVGFNVGIELAQLSLVLPALFFGHHLLKHPQRFRLGMQAFSLSAAALGAWWFVQRTVGDMM